MHLFQNFITRDRFTHHVQVRRLVNHRTLTREFKMQETTQTEVENAASKVTVYGASWCPNCKRTKKFFAEQRVHNNWVDSEAVTEIAWAWAGSS